MPIHKANDVEEAVELAARLRDEREYDWFRGQVENYPLRSSYTRLSHTEQQAVLDRLGVFEHWISSTQGLEPLAQNVDARIAVAQHYGIPSTFIDFTTDPCVAGFFASDRPPENPSAYSCILCLNTEDLSDFWKSMVPQHPPPEFLRIDVSNLWRLEAQSGVFLFCPYANFEQIYNVDRILFPYTQAASRPTRDEIYPTRKSHLEVLLDQYFMIEKLRAGDRYIQQQIARGNWSVHMLHLKRKQRWDPELVVLDGPPKLDSWHSSTLRPWLSPEPERYSHVRSEDRFSIVVPASFDDAASREGFRNEIEGRLANLASRRASLISWSIEMPAAATSRVSASSLSNRIARLWDGVRVLPYTITDISASVANCIILAVSATSEKATSSGDPWGHAASVCFGDSIEVEFGPDDSSYARAYVGKKSLLQAVRRDIREFLNPEHAEALLGDMTGLLQAVQAPDRLFDFNRLSTVFVREIVPIQVLTRSKLAIFYSPARLDAFGLP